MEDAATAEISRAQVWQWIRHRATLQDGRRITSDLVRGILAEEIDRIRSASRGDDASDGRLDDARDLFLEVSTSEHFQEFLTLPAYEILTGSAGSPKE